MTRQPTLAILVLLLLLPACSASDSTSQGGTCAGPKTYAAGSTVTGTTIGASCKSPDGSQGELYTMTLTQQSNMLLTVAASGFPGFIGLYTSAGDVIELNNSDLKVKAFLPAGTYQVFVNSTSSAGGTFTLTSPVTSLDGCSSTTGGGPDLGHTVKGASFSGTVVATDCGNALSKTDIYEVALKAGAVLNVSITVDRVSGLSVTNPSGATVASQNMTAAGTFITAVTATTAGRYLLHIESRTVNGSSNLPLAYSVVLN